MKIPVIVLFAPTATGKTALAIDLFGKSSLFCFKEKAELISADSMQVYKGLDIGTAKPTLKEREELPHYLLDIATPDVQFSVSDFVHLADSLCSDIFLRSKIPLIAGGTGFYIRNFILGLPKTPASDEKIRQMLKNRLEKEGKEALYKELCSVDFESAEKINKNDVYRILRALEVFYSTGKPRSSFKMSSEMRSLYDFKIIVLDCDREVLYKRINLRVEKMFSDGLYDEVKSLFLNGCTKDMPGMQAIGYREWFTQDGKLRTDVQNVMLEIQHDSRKYAKKQYTYMADIPGAIRISLTEPEKMKERVFLELQDFIKEN